MCSCKTHHRSRTFRQDPRQSCSIDESRSCIRVPFGIFRPILRACGTPCDVFAGPYRACLRSAGLCHAPEFLQISRITKKAARALAKSKASPPKRAPLHARLPSHSFARASIFLDLLLHSRLECPLYGCWVSAPVASPAGTVVALGGFRRWNRHFHFQDLEIKTLPPQLSLFSPSIVRADEHYSYTSVPT